MVTFGRSVQPAQYETKKAEVQLTFTLAEGEALGPTLDVAASLAQDKALEMVGLKKSTAVTTSVQPSPGATGGKEAYAAAQAATKEAPKEKKPVGRPPNPDKVKIEEKPQISTSPEDRKDPAAMDDSEADALDAMLELDTPPEPITDKQLIEKIGIKNKALADKNAGIPQPRKIKELIAKYSTHAHSIPAEKRQDFLDKLETLE